MRGVVYTVLGKHWSLRSSPWVVRLWVEVDQFPKNHNIIVRVFANVARCSRFLKVTVVLENNMLDCKELHIGGGVRHQPFALWCQSTNQVWLSQPTYPRHSMGLPYMPTLTPKTTPTDRQSYGSSISRVWVYVCMPFVRPIRPVLGFGIRGCQARRPTSPS